MLGYFLNHTCDTNVSELRKNKRLSVRNIVTLLRLEGCDPLDLRCPTDADLLCSEQISDCRSETLSRYFAWKVVTPSTCGAQLTPTYCAQKKEVSVGQKHCSATSLGALVSLVFLPVHRTPSSSTGRGAR